MSILKPQAKPLERQALTCKLERPVFDLLRAYCRYLASTQEYVLRESLLFTFRKDHDFRQWLAQNEPAQLDALRVRTSEPARPTNATPIGSEE